MLDTNFSHIYYIEVIMKKKSIVWLDYFVCIVYELLMSTVLVYSANFIYTYVMSNVEVVRHIAGILLAWILNIVN